MPRRRAPAVTTLSALARAISMSNPQDKSDRHGTRNLNSRAPRIGVLGHFGDRNLGDEALIQAFVCRLQREWPAAELRLFSVRPGDTARRYQLPAFAIRQEGERQGELRIAGELLAEPATTADGAAPAPARALARDLPWLLEFVARWVPQGRLRSSLGALSRNAFEVLREIPFLRRSLRRVQGLDVMFVTGSNQFVDNFGGAWGFPYTLLKWTLLCRLSGCRVFFVSVGAGPLEGAASKRMIAWALRLADYVSFRDDGSRALIERVCGRTGPVYPDLAHSLETPEPVARVASDVELRPRPRIVINPMPIHDPRFWPVPDPVKYQAFVESIAALTRRLRDDGYPIQLFATQIADANVARDVLRAARGDAGRSSADDCLPVAIAGTVQELMDFLGQADLVVATRFHGILLGLLAGKPTVGICYYRKSRELLREAGQEECAFDIHTVTADQLYAACVQLASRLEQAAADIAAANKLHREALELQYQSLFQRVAAIVGMA